MAFKMNGMNFGRGTGSASPNKATKEWQMSEDTGGKYDKKVTTRKNLFGRDRMVTKYFDPETGEKVGKEVRVDRGKNDPRADKVKTKKVNPGLYQSGGVGKIRVKEGFFEGDGPGNNNKTNGDGGGGLDNRAEYALHTMDHENVSYDEDGKPIIPTYTKSFNSFELKDGKRYNPSNKKYYTNDEAGLKQYEDDSEAWWAEQAARTENPKLKHQGSEYGRDY
jgi:hypothetical protein